MLFRYVLSLLAITAFSVQAATWPAASVARTDVNAAIGLSSNGDTVTVPAGISDWGGSGLTVSKSITISGAGTNSCIISNSAKGLNLFITVDGVKIQGFKFVKVISGGTSPDDQAILVNGKTCSGSGAQINSCVIQNCVFYGGRRVVSVTGYAYGGCFRCGFDNNDIGVGMNGDNDAAWARPITLGSSNAWYVENCYFNKRSNLHNECVYHNSEGTRSVIRYNTFFSPVGVTDVNFIDAHGNNNYVTCCGACGSQRGTVSSEIYMNTFTAQDSGYRMAYLRGGCYVVFSNTLSSPSVVSFPMCSEEEGWLSSNFSPLRTVWPAQDQITNAFYYANTLNGSAITTIGQNNAADATFIQKNRDWWNEKPGGSNGRPLGIYASYTPFTYPHPLTGNPTAGVIALSSSGYSVNEAAGTVTITLQRQGANTGTVTVDYATSNGTAQSGVNYTTTTGTKTWTSGDSADKTFTIPIINAGTCGSPTFNVTIANVTGGATLGSPTTAVITITGSGSTTPPTLPGYGPWDAADAAICSPFLINGGGKVTQSVTTTDPATGGRLALSFTVTTTDDFTISASIKTPADDSNSCFIDVDSEPTTGAIWDAVINGGSFVNQFAAWTRVSPAQNPKVWHLTAGTHTLIVRGREGDMEFSSFTLTPVAGGTVTSITTTVASGYYAAGASVPITVNLSAPATVTGTPTLAMGNGLTLSYVSGSGTSALTFAYTVGTGHDTQGLDYLNTTALTGTIKDAGGNAFLLTLPAPGTPGSISFAKKVVIDTTKPIVSIGTPSLVLTFHTDVMFVITYIDQNLDDSSITLVNGNVTFTTTGSVTGTVTVSGSTGNVRTVKVSNLNGTGTFKISIAGGTCTDLAGNVALGAGPSDTVTVSSFGTGQSISTKAGTVVSGPKL